MEKLPQEIKLDIFSRLSVESILEYKQVCKSWLSLLNDPSFAQIHLRRRLCLLHHQYSNNDDDAPHGSSTSTSTTTVPCGGGGEFGFVALVELDNSEGLVHWELLYGKYDENDEQSYNIVKKINHPTFINTTTFGGMKFIMIGSCNGLICLSIPTANVKTGHPTHIFNPITSEYVNLPRLSDDKSYSKPFSKITSGFGYHPSTNEYKVVRIFYYKELGNEKFGQVHVYTLGAGSGWRDKGEIAYPFWSMDGHKAIFANGRLHWLDREENIVAFDLADEEFHFIPSPPIVHFEGDSGKHHFRKLCELGGWLGLAHHVLSETGSSSYVEIWLLKKKCRTGYGVNEQEHECWGWIKEFNIPTDFEHDVVSLLALTKRGELLFWDFLYCICRYDPKSATIETLEAIDGKCIKAIPHINSFVSLKALGESLTE